MTSIRRRGCKIIGLAIRLVLSAAVIFSLTPSTFACSIFTTAAEMPSSFVTEVQDEGVGVAGLLVRVTQDQEDGDSKEILVGHTDSKGTYQVKNLRPAEYGVSVGSNTAFQAYSRIRVEQRSLKRRSAKLRMNWITADVLRLQRFSGVLREKELGEDGHKVGRYLANVKLVARNARLNTIVAETVTDANGAFDLSGLPKGLYRIDLIPDTNPSFDGELAVEITSGADAFSEPLEIAAAFTSCGIMYDVKLQGSAVESSRG